MPFFLLRLHVSSASSAPSTADEDASEDSEEDEVSEAVDSPDYVGGECLAVVSAGGKRILFL